MRIKFITINYYVTRNSVYYNSRYESCSKTHPAPQGSAVEQGCYINVISIKKCFHILFSYIRHSKDRINVKVFDNLAAGNV